MLARIARALVPACFAAVLAAAPSLAFPEEPSARVMRPKPIVEVAFVLDTTGSMGPLIEGAKRKIWSIATAIIDANPNAEIRMGLVAYRDIGDEYVTKTFNLTTDIQDLYANLLELKARGGGDWPESVNEALEVGVTKLTWTQGAEICRIMFLVGDAPPHMDYAQDTKYPDVIRMAHDRGAWPSWSRSATSMSSNSARTRRRSRGFLRPRCRDTAGADQTLTSALLRRGH